MIYHMMPLLLHLSDLRCKCFLYRPYHGEQSILLTGAMNELTMKKKYILKV